MRILMKTWAIILALVGLTCSIHWWQFIFWTFPEMAAGKQLIAWGTSTYNSISTTVQTWGATATAFGAIIGFFADVVMRLFLIGGPIFITLAIFCYIWSRWSFTDHIVTHSTDMVYIGVRVIVGGDPTRRAWANRLLGWMGLDQYERLRGVFHQFLLENPDLAQGKIDPYSPEEVAAFARSLDKFYRSKIPQFQLAATVEPILVSTLRRN